MYGIDSNSICQQVAADYVAAYPGFHRNTMVCFQDKYRSACSLLWYVIIPARLRRCSYKEQLERIAEGRSFYIRRHMWPLDHRREVQSREYYRLKREGKGKRKALAAKIAATKKAIESRK